MRIYPTVDGQDVLAFPFFLPLFLNWRGLDLVVNCEILESCVISHVLALSKGALPAVWGEDAGPAY